MRHETESRHVLRYREMRIMINIGPEPRRKKGRMLTPLVTMSCRFRRGKMRALFLKGTIAVYYPILSYPAAAVRKAGHLRIRRGPWAGDRLPRKVTMAGHGESGGSRYTADLRGERSRRRVPGCDAGAHLGVFWDSCSRTCPGIESRRTARRAGEGGCSSSGICTPPILSRCLSGERALRRDTASAGPLRMPFPGIVCGRLLSVPRTKSEGGRIGPLQMRRARGRSKLQASARLFDGGSAACSEPWTPRTTVTPSRRCADGLRTAIMHRRRTWIFPFLRWSRLETMAGANSRDTSASNCHGYLRLTASLISTRHPPPRSGL
ncbi:hypothetical protein BV25DRAFT_1729834 [Artomyces pyxidatus]|uniref:Uncharacterized protein n=1 Tax=Artomyces pyxidatus TaxID=48021 RepID=A0ACB8SGT2_9AGAM|nr:hypothetical protein BV25DRAFT_1729834 [Artomyces pyxidatus]